MTHAQPPLSDFAKAILALALPLPGAAGTCRTPLGSRWMRRAWRAAYVRVTAGRAEGGASVDPPAQPRP